MSAEAVNVAVDLEGTLEDNTAVVREGLAEFVEENYSFGELERAAEETGHERKELVKEGSEGLEIMEESFRGWDLDPWIKFLSKLRSWDNGLEFELFMHGEDFIAERKDYEPEEFEGEYWPGFHEVINSEFMGDAEFELLDRDATLTGLEALNQMDPDYIGLFDVVTTRSDNEEIYDKDADALTEADEYSISDGLEQAIRDYLEEKGILTHPFVTGLEIEADKSGHENGYGLFFDDKPPEYFNLRDGQTQILMDPYGEFTDEVIDFGSYVDRDIDLEDLEDLEEVDEEYKSTIRVGSVREGFEAIFYLAAEKTGDPDEELNKYRQVFDEVK